MNYREIPPRPELARHVNCFWTLRGAGGGVERVLPDGCCELILNRAAPFRGLRDDGTVRVHPRFMLVGQIDRFILIEPTGAVDLVGIRFRPAGLFALVGAPMGELTARRIELDAVSRSLRRDLEAADSIAAIEEALLRHVRPTCGRAAAAAAFIESSRGGARIDAVARHVGVSGRSLERVFRREVGLSPKRLSRIARFQSVVRGVERTGRLDWAAAALACGYFDQAHLINEFRDFAGLSPTRYFASEHPMSDFFTGRAGRAEAP